MIQLSHQTRILLATQAADFRKGIDGFVALCRIELKKDPRSGTCFVFINRNRTMIRVLVYDGTGFWLMTKRLSKGKYLHWPHGSEPITPLQAKQLSVLLQNSEVNQFIGNQGEEVSKKA